MWCPRCNRQYDDELDTCIKCGCELEDYTPILSEDDREFLESEEEQEKEELITPPEDIMPELLVSVVGEEEAHRLAALLESFRIPCLCRPACEEEPVISEEEYEGEGEILDEQLTPPKEQEDDTIFDLLIPKMMFPKALRILNEDSIRQEETLLEEDMLPEFEEEEEQSEEPIEEVQPEQPKKKKKGFLGFFGKNR